MTPTETAAILRQFNEWRRGDEDIPQFDLYKVDAAIDAAAEMIERLELAEKDIALKERIIDSLGSTLNAVANERDALRARVEAMERQEPVAWIGQQYTLLFVGSGSMTELVKRHGISSCKIGSMSLWQKVN